MLIDRPSHLLLHSRSLAEWPLSSCRARSRPRRSRLGLTTSKLGFCHRLWSPADAGSVKRICSEFQGKRFSPNLAAGSFNPYKVQKDGQPTGKGGIRTGAMGNTPGGGMGGGGMGMVGPGRGGFNNGPGRGGFARGGGPPNQGGGGGGLGGPGPMGMMGNPMMGGMGMGGPMMGGMGGMGMGANPMMGGGPAGRGRGGFGNGQMPPSGPGGYAAGQKRQRFD